MLQAYSKRIQLSSYLLDITLAALAGLALAPNMFLSVKGRASPPRVAPLGPQDLPTVEVSAISIEPGSIHQTRGQHGPATAAVTVQIAHQPLASAQTVSLSIGTFSTDPPSGVSLSYKPPIQTVTIPAGAEGKVTATARVEDADIGKISTATAVVAAMLTNPSRGVRVLPMADSPPEDWQARITVKNP